MAKALFIFKNIIYSFKSEKILTVLILLGMVVCDTIFLVFGNVFWSDTNSNEYEIYKNNVVTLGIDAKDMDRFMETTESRDHVTSTFFRCTETDGENLPVSISAYSPAFDPSGQRIRLGHGLTGAGGECVVSNGYLQREGSAQQGSGTGQESHAALSGSGTGQDPHDALSGSGTGQDPHDALPGSSIGRRLHFLGADWTCTGVIAPSPADDFDILIDMADFKTYVNQAYMNQTDVDQTDAKGRITAGFRYEKGTSLVEIQDFANALKEKFHVDFVAVPSRTAGASFGEFLSDMSGMLILLVIAILNYMSLYRFLVQKRMYNYGVFKLQGMDNRLALAGLSVEMLIFLIVAFSFSLLLYCGGTALSGRLGTVMQHVPEFWFSFVIISVINLFFFGLTSVKLIRTPPVELIRESEVG